MSKLLSVNVLNREYIDNINKCIEDARRFINYENKETDDCWSIDVGCMLHQEIIRIENIRIGKKSEIFSYDEQYNCGLVEIDNKDFEYLYIDTGNNKYITVTNFDTLDKIYDFIVYNNDEEIIDLIANWEPILVPVQLIQNMELKEKIELLRAINEFIED